jgi:hypothetical protein
MSTQTAPTDADALRAELDALQRQHEAALVSIERLGKAYREKEAAHMKLSAIVKMALSPERYHEARAEAVAAYPDLPWSK